MQTTLFTWAEKEGVSIPALAKRLGYSERHLYRIRSGEHPVTNAFAGRVVFVLGDWARSLFLPLVSDKSDTPSETKEASHA